MPPANTGQPRIHPGAPTDRPTTVADWPPPLLDPDALAELPVPVQMVVVSALLPYEVATTSLRILKNTEALLGELVFHMNALRPAVSGVSQAYADGQFDQFFRTFGQIQQGTSAVALVWAPLTGLRDRLVPGPAAPPRVSSPMPPPVPDHRPHGGPDRARPYSRRPGSPVPPPPSGYPPPQPVTVAAVPPSTIEYVGRLGGALLDQAASLPGAGWLRRGPAPQVDTEPFPVAAAYAPPVASPASPRLRHGVDPHGREAAGVLEVAGAPETAEPSEPAGGPSLLGLAAPLAPLVPGPVRRLFGG